MTTSTDRSAPVVSNEHGLKLMAVCKRMLYRRLRLYAMTMQTADIDDIVTDSWIKTIETFNRRPPQTASEIRVAIWLSVRGTLCDWIDKQSTASEHLCPFVDDEPIDALDIADVDTPTETRLPAYIGRLCHTVGEVRAAFVLSGQTFDGRTFAEMPNDIAAEQLEMSVRSVQRMKDQLRQRLALFAPDKTDKRELVTPNR